MLASSSSRFSAAALLVLSLCAPSLAATAEQWRGRSIYQLITDRYALPSGASTTDCDAAKQLRCGGTWNAIRENLDYISNMGFTAVWISPVTQAIDDTTAYGQSYHGYWAGDITKLNDHMGTSDDLKALSAELHKRDMYLMVDVVVNNVAATTTKPDYSKYMFKDQKYYHSYCPISWGNTQSEQDCWMGDDKVPLPDVDTRNADVISQYGDWIEKLVQTYGIDGLRIDAAKHVNKDFWPGFCKKAGVFCLGEVFSGLELDVVTQYQGTDALDAVLNFPMREALSQAFSIPGPKNVSAIQTTMEASKQQFKDVGILGNFLENHDLPRWASQSVDIQTLFNAMTFNFMSDGIPIVYYGQEQNFNGNADPNNREPLWPSKYAKTPTYTLVATLNQLRNYLVNQTDWVKSGAEILTTSTYGVALIKGEVISILTNIGSPAQNGTNIAVQSPYSSSTSLTNIFSCQQWAVGSNGMLDVEYTKGGVPVVLVPSDMLRKSGMCGAAIDQAQSGSAAASQNSATSVITAKISFSSFFIAILLPCISSMLW